MAESVRSELKAAFYLATGRYNIVAISEAAKVDLAIGLPGNETSETLRAFTEYEYRAIVAALPDLALLVLRAGLATTTVLSRLSYGSSCYMLGRDRMTGGRKLTRPPATTCL